MDIQDHAYIDTTEDNTNPPELFYKMTAKEIEEFVKLRASNSFLFSGKRNTSTRAWRAILKHMGLHHKVTHCQAKKKWENMKKRYKDLQCPPNGGTDIPATWRFFSLMKDAVEGRLLGSAPILEAFPSEDDCSDFLPVSKPRKRKRSTMMIPSFSPIDGPEMEVILSGEEEGNETMPSMERMDFFVEEVVQEGNGLVDNKEQVMVMHKERLVLQRERAVLDREIAVLERDRALLERERAMMEREKAMIDRERAMMAKDREAVCRERLALEKERAKLERLSAPKTENEEVTENGSAALEASDTTDIKERFFTLFEKLLETLEK